MHRFDGADKLVGQLDGGAAQIALELRHRRGSDQIAGDEVLPSARGRADPRLAEIGAFARAFRSTRRRDEFFQRAPGQS